MQWHEIEAWASERLANARIRNDGQLDPTETANLRGQIGVLKELLALPSRQKVMEAQARFNTPMDDSHGF